MKGGYPASVLHTIFKLHEILVIPGKSGPAKRKAGDERSILKKMEERICAKCGKPFMPQHSQQKYCSAECRDIEKERKKKEYYEAHREQYLKYGAVLRARKSYLKNWKSGMSLAEKAARARELGVSYGRYVGMMRLEAEK